MAVLSKFPGLEVTVTLNGHTLQEYEDADGDNPQSSTVTKYIEAKSNTLFCVTFCFKPPFPTFYGVEVRLSIDGRAMAGQCFHGSDLYNNTSRWDGYSWKRNGEWVEQRFRFSQLDIVEETRMSRPEIAALRRDLGAKGRITLEFWFAKDILDWVYPIESKPDQLTAPRHIPETALKGNALSHQTTLTKAKRSNCQTGPKTRLCNRVDKDPFATFHFKYRSLASLQALRVVEVNESTPVPLEERPEEELSPEELRELVRRMRQRSVTIKPDPEAQASIKLEKIPYDDDEVAFVESRPCKRARTDAETLVID